MVNFKPKDTYELPRLHSLLPNVLQFKMDNLKISEIKRYFIFVL